MTDTLHLEIITAGGAVVDTPAAQITLPLADGEVGILPGHAPFSSSRAPTTGASHRVRPSPWTAHSRPPARSITVP